MRVPRVRFTVRVATAVTGLIAVMAGMALWLQREVVSQRHEAAMSLDIVFSTCNLGTRQVQARNPFTGATMATFDDPGLTRDERAEVARLLHRLKAEGPDTHGFYRIHFPDGGEADLLAPHLAGEAKFDGCSVEAHGLTAGVADFLFRLGVAGNMMIHPAAEGVGTLVLSEGQQREVAARYPDAKLVRSAAALGEELRPGFESSKRYRDQVVGEAE